MARRLIPNLLLGTPPDPAALEEGYQDLEGYRGIGKTSNSGIAYGDAFTLRISQRF